MRRNPSPGTALPGRLSSLVSFMHLRVSNSIDKSDLLRRAGSAVLFLALLSGSTLIRAKDAKPPPPINPVAVVPYDPDKPIEDQDPTRYYIDYSTFQSMWDKVKQHRISKNKRNSALANAPKDHTLSAALYQIKSTSELLSVTGQISLTTRGGQWQKVPLPFKGINLSRITLDGEPASYSNGAILVEEIGNHLIEVEFQVPVAENSETGKWSFPSAGGTMLQVEMDSDIAEPVLQDNWPLAKSRTPDGKVYYTTAIGQRTQLELRRRLKTSGRGMTRPNLAVIDARLYIAQGLERLESDFQLEFEGQEENRFTISFDSSLTPVQFEIPNLSSWEMGETVGDLRTLTFNLSQPVQDRVLAKMIAERIVNEDSGEARTFPVLSAVATRIEQRRSLLRVWDLDVKALPGSRHRQIPSPSGSKDGSGFIAVSTHSLMGENEALRYETSVEDAERAATVSYVYQVGSGKMETIARFKVSSPEAPLLNNSFTIPEDSKIQLVSGNRIRDWWRTGNELFVRYRGGTPENTEVIIYITQQIDADAADSIAIIPISIDDIPDNKVKGTGLVVGHVTRDISLALDQNRQTIREVGATEVLVDSEILPPLERKRGFRFEKASFSGRIALSDIAPKYNALWVMLAQVHESWTRLSIHTDVEVTQSGVDRFSFETPESMPQLRVLSDEVRELRHELIDGVRKYEVVFQRFVTGSISFTLETEIPHSGEAVLPDLKIPGATRQERFVIVENQSSARMNLQQSGMDKTVSEMLPFKPQSLISAQLFRATPAWSLTAKLEELETSAGNDAVILYAELTSAFRSNGEEWLKAVYHIQNRSLQFLPVRLQEDAELVSVVVDGSEVRADRTDKEEGAAILVPLIQTKPGQLAYDVELVLRSRNNVIRNGTLPTDFEKTLDDPDIVGTTVEKTMWNVFLPQGHVLEDFDGNMEQVMEEANLYRKLQADLQELKLINGIASDEGNGISTRQFSILNCAVLVDRIEDQVTQLNKRRAYGRGNWDSSSGVSSSGGNAPINDVQRELEEQKALIVGNKGKIAQSSGSQQVQFEDDGQEKYFRNNDVRWGLNSFEIKKRGQEESKKVTDQLKRVESQIRLNDNISIGGTTTAEVSDKEKGWTNYSQLQKLEENPGSGKVDAKLSALNLSQNGAIMDQQQQSDVKPKPKALKKQTKKLKDLATLNNFGDLDNARSTVAAKAKVRPVPQANAPASQPQKPTAAEPDPFGGGGAASQAAPIDSSGQRPSVITMNGVRLQNTGQLLNGIDPISGIMVKKPAMKAEGRRSVNVNFPTEGEAYYFQKLKDHAELQIESELPGDSKRLKWLILFAICIAILLGGRAVLGRYQNRSQNVPATA